MAQILIVDDVQTDRELLAKVVTREGHTPLYAENGDQAIEIAMQSVPDLILMDVVMPKRDGFSTLRKLRSEDATKNIPVVLVTSKDKDSDKFWGKRQGANDYLVKPFSPTELAQVIKKHV